MRGSRLTLSFPEPRRCIYKKDVTLFFKLSLYVGHGTVAH